jgi:hypothetical protein
MVSNINYASIDSTYPIAGQDNDSQGFRDNFGYIKNGLTTAASEISDLQSSTAKTNAATDFNYQQISKAAFVNCGEVIYNPQTPIETSSDSAATVLYTNGSLQIFQITDSVTLTLSGFPANPANQTNNTSVVSKIRLHVTSSGNHDLTFRVNSGVILKSLGTNTTSKTYTSGGAIGATTFVVDSDTDVSMDQLIIGTGLPKETYVTSVSSKTVESTKSNPTLPAGALMKINGTTIAVPDSPNNTINGLLNVIYGLSANSTALRITSIISNGHVTAYINSGILEFYCDSSISAIQIEAPSSGTSLVTSSAASSQIGIAIGTYNKPTTSTIRLSKAFTAQAAGAYNFYNGNVKNPVSLNNVGVYIFDFWTYNGGTALYMNYVGNFEVV